MDDEKEDVEPQWCMKIGWVEILGGTPTSPYRGCVARGSASLWLEKLWESVANSIRYKTRYFYEMFAEQILKS